MPMSQKPKENFLLCMEVSRASRGRNWDLTVTRSKNKKTRSLLAFKRSREVTKGKLDEIIQFVDFRIGL